MRVICLNCEAVCKERDELKLRCERLRFGHEAMTANDQMTFGDLYIERDALNHEVDRLTGELGVLRLEKSYNWEGINLHYKAEIQRLKGESENLKMTEKVYHMNRDWIADAKVEIQSLKDIAESYRAKLSDLVNALELANPISAHVEAALINARSALKEQGRM